MALTRPLRRRTDVRRAAQLGAVVAVSALALSACGSGAKVSSSQGSRYVTSSSGIVTAAKSGRQTAPELSGKTIEGKTLDVNSAYKGKIVVLNVWGSWCPPCRAEAGNLAKVSRDLKSKGVEFVGINTRDTSTGPAKAFEKSYDVPYPSLYDPTGKLLLRFPSGSLNPQAIPSTVVIDRDGKIAARKAGGVEEDTLRKMIDPLITEK
ncbi:TlpA family protein disulfide reductase [Streptomyces sp. SID10853]|uniref:TlpA family protein disulfide reductase n=1 Tax=Streptomyces sp. SID10853 TaxID=2706028 RepID=UPI0013BFC694|nr:TlpA disulfide reductase family protein [Streptomyces sp. SID10853]NDZ82550.1 TlpA family protein disulfide reductase [Streptomyces sp. SID10853]